MIFDELRGRLEVVHIDRIRFGDLCVGTFEGNEVLVRYGQHHVGKDCIIRFSNKQRSELPFSFFISSHIPPGFRGLGPYDYILEGVVDLGEVYNKPARAMETLFGRYRPGDVFSLFYLPYPSESRSHPRFLITPWAVRSDYENSIAESIDHLLPDPYKSSRVVVAKDGDSYKNLCSKVLLSRFRGIEMEPLQH